MRIHLLLVIVAASLGLPLVTPATDVQAEPPLTIAGLFDLSGGGAIWGKSERNAFDLAVQDFKERHPNIPVSALVEDSQYSSRQAVSALQKLISINKVQYLVGTTWETTAAIMPICEARKVVCISPSYHGREYYARPWRYNFSAWFEDKGYMTALVSELNERDVKRIAVFAAVTSYYDQLVDVFLAQSRQKPLIVERMALEERDFRSILARTPHDLDAVVMLLDNAGQIQAFLKQWAENRRDRPEIFTDDLIVYLEPPEDISRYGFTFFYSTPVFDEHKLAEFSARYQKAFGVRPEGSSAVVSYDETTILLECARTKRDVEAVRDCVAATNGYPGYSGTFSFAGGQTVRDRKIAARRLDYARPK